jgi:hypothetical protein
MTQSEKASSRDGAQVRQSFADRQPAAGFQPRVPDAITSTLRNLTSALSWNFVKVTEAISIRASACVKMPSIIFMATRRTTHHDQTR